MAQPHPRQSRNVFANSIYDFFSAMGPLGIFESSVDSADIPTISGGGPYRDGTRVISTNKGMELNPMATTAVAPTERPKLALSP